MPQRHPRPRSLGFWLRCLAAACILPPIIVAAALISDAYVRQRTATAETNVATARALMQVVDRELVRAQTSMQALATSPLLQNDDLAAFYAQALQVLVATGSNSVVLSDLDGRQIINTYKPFGAQLPRRNELVALRRTVETGKPVISDVVLGSVSLDDLVTVNVPVLCDGKPRYVLDATLTSRNFLDIFDRQKVPQSAVLILLDNVGTIVAGSRPLYGFAGRKPPHLGAVLNGGAVEGAFENRTSGGIDVLTAFSRSPASGWTVAISTPYSDVDADLSRTLWLSIGCASTLLVLGFSASQLISLRIGRSINLLREPAKALAAGEPVIMPAAAIAEVREVGDALVAAAALLKQRQIDQAKIAATDRQLAISERDVGRFSALMEAAPYALVVVRGDGSISFVNGQVVDMFGYSREALVGKRIEILVAEQQRVAHAAHRDGFFAASEARPMGTGHVLMARRRDGDEFPVDVGLSPLEFDGEKLVIAVVNDITERERLEAEVAANHLQSMASARLSSLGAMAGGIAHEINNPLAVIHAVADELAEDAARDAAPAAAVLEASRQITAMTERISKIIRSLHHLAGEGGSDPLVETALRDVVEKALQLSRPVFSSGHVALIAAPIPAKPRILCREVEISQVLLNLLQNASDAAEEQANETGRAQWVRLNTSFADGRAMLSVTDSGKGVPPALVTRIMEPFFTTKPVGKGTGLGLSMSRQIAEMHGGTIELGSADGHTRFVLTLPLAAGAPPDARISA